MSAEVDSHDAVAAVGKVSPCRPVKGGLADEAATRLIVAVSGGASHSRQVSLTVTHNVREETGSLWVKVQTAREEVPVVGPIPVRSHAVVLRVEDVLEVDL